MTTAKLFLTGRSQAIRLPKAFRFLGKEVYIKRVHNGVLLIPKDKESQETFWKNWYHNIPEVDVPLERADLPPQERDWE